MAVPFADYTHAVLKEDLGRTAGRRVQNVKRGGRDAHAAAETSTAFPGYEPMVKGIWLRLMGDPPLVVFVLSLSLGPHQMHPHGKEKLRLDLAGAQTFHEIFTPISYGLFSPFPAGRRGVLIWERIATDDLI